MRCRKRGAIVASSPYRCARRPSTLARQSSDGPDGRVRGGNAAATIEKGRYVIVSRPPGSRTHERIEHKPHRTAAATLEAPRGPAHKEVIPVSNPDSTPTVPPAERARANRCRRLADRISYDAPLADIEAIADHLLALAHERREMTCHVCGRPVVRLAPWTEAVSCHADHSALEVAQ
jgi:hypothetical protein